MTIVQELRDIASSEAVKGKHFFLESDVRGPALKLDNTGKAILTVSACAFVVVIFLIFQTDGKWYNNRDILAIASFVFFVFFPYRSFVILAV